MIAVLFAVANRIGGTAHLRRAALLLCVIATHGCGESSARTSAVFNARPGETDWPNQIDTASVSVRVDPTSMTTVPLIAPEPNLSIGRSSEDADHQFGIIAGIALDAKDQIFVLDPYSFRVRTYTRDGKFIRDIGRRGDGPSEFAQPHGPLLALPGNGVAVVDSTLWVLDNSLKAFSTVDGRFVGSTPPELEFENVVSLAAASDGLRLIRAPFRDFATLQYRFDIYDTQSHSVRPGFEVRYHLTDSGPTGLQTAPIPLPTLPYSVSSRGIYFTVGDSFHIRRYGFDGQIEKTYVSPVPRVRVTDVDVQDFISSVNHKMAIRRPSGQPEEAVRRQELEYGRKVHNHPRADYREAIRMMIASDAGDLLVRRSDTNARPYDTTKDDAVMEWTLISEGGGVLGRVQLPSRFNAKIFKGCDLYGTTEDSDGAQLLVRYSLSPLACSQNISRRQPDPPR